MNEKIKNYVVTFTLAAFLLALSLFAWFKPADKTSTSERRPLDQFPSFTVETVFGTDGKPATFMKDFEDYTLDQFPLRDSFRSLKSMFSLFIYNNMDNNGLYLEDGYVAKMEDKLDEVSVDNAVSIFSGAYDKLISESNSKVYLSVIPDKGYYLSDKSGNLKLDYDALVKALREGLPFAEYVDIFGELDYTDYYRTDTHWKQEELTDVADKIATAMGATLPTEYTVNTLDVPFYGVYYGQLALPLKPDEIKYLTNDTLDSLKVTAPDPKGFGFKEVPLYNMEKAKGNDAYDMFLSGARVSVINIENPNAATDKELVVFRDSYGSSLVPLIAQGYAKITVLDLRELSANQIKFQKYASFENDPDVLFLLSTLVVNASGELKK